MSAQHQNISPRERAHLFSSLLRKPHLIPEIIRDHIRLLVFEDELAEASEVLLELMDKYAPKKTNEVIIIHRQIVEIETAARVNTLEDEAISRKKNRLGKAILDLADSVCKKH